MTAIRSLIATAVPRALLAAALLIAAATPSRSERFQEFVTALWPEAEARGVSRATFDAAFKGVTPDMSLPDLDRGGGAAESPKADNRGQAEFTRPPSAYMDRKYLTNLGSQGRQFLAEHKAELDIIEQKFGVDRSSLLAFWGRETAFGSHKPPHDAIRVIATQAFAGRRKDFFRNELLCALEMLEAGVARSSMRSSWAGAMGLTQFMPSEYKPYAQDIDGDGKRDIFKSVGDALGSTAAQLAGKGWVRGETWGYEVAIPEGADCAYEGPTQERTIGEWAKLGFVRVGNRPWGEKQLGQKAYLMSPAGAYGPSFLALENFKVIRKYNTTDLYALFVGHLSDRIGGGGDFVTPWTSSAPQKTVVVEEIQVLLKAAGYEVDKIDGRIGSNTRKNVGQYQRKAKIKVDCWPSDEVLAHLRANAPRTKAAATP